MQRPTSPKVLRFQNTSLMKMYGAAFLGFYLGLKVCDFFFYDHDSYEVMREQMEDEYWAKFGEPQYLQPDIVNSVIPGNEHIKRKSWIYIKLAKDKYIEKKDD